ncbi:MAG: Dabb family protein [Pseudomonadota bacterium]
MIRHIVLLKARPEVTDTHIASIFADLHALNLPGLLAIHSGRSESPEQIERGYLHGFTVDFADWQALAAYQDHPDHKRAGAALVAAAQGGLDGILVFDLPC